MTEAPSDKQLGFLKRLGYNGPEPSSKQEASALIEKLAGKSEKKSSGYTQKPQAQIVLKVSLSKDEITAIQSETTDLTERAIVVLDTIRKVCQANGFSEPAVVGMIFNQVQETKRRLANL